MLTAVSRLPALRLPPLDRRHLPSTLVLLTMVLLYLLAGLSVTSVDGSRANATPMTRDFVAATRAAPQEIPPVPEPLAFRDMTPQQAAEFNASIPVSTESNPAARPFVLGPATENDRLRALDCLTAAVYYEAAIEPTEGQRAVAQVVLNRVRHPAFPKSVCGVVFQGSERTTGCQFTFTCDGSIARTPSEAGWERARKVAEAALAGEVYKPVGYATHYHTNWVVPYWSSSLTKLALVGTHIFYRWEGGWGRPPAFRYNASGAEPEIALMRRLSSVPMEAADAEVMADATAPGTGLAGAEPLATPADFAGRAVVRRYEPLRAEAAAAAKAEYAKPEVPVSVRWALTGDTATMKTAAPPAAKPAMVPNAPQPTAANVVSPPAK